MSVMGEESQDPQAEDEKLNRESERWRLYIVNERLYRHRHGKYHSDDGDMVVKDCGVGD